MSEFFSADDFSASSPDVQGGGGKRDERFVGGRKEGGEGYFCEGENLFALLPPFSDYRNRATEIKRKRLAEGKPPALPLSNNYMALRIKSQGDKYPRMYRVGSGCHIANAFRDIYEEMKMADGKMGDELKAIQKHMGGFGEERGILNIYLPTTPGRVLWWDCTLKPIERLVSLVPKYITQLPNQLFFDLDVCAVLAMDLSFSSSIPQYQSAHFDVHLTADRNLETFNARKHIAERVAGFSEQTLDAALEYAQGNDEASLPALGSIPALAAHGGACEILRAKGYDITTAAASTSSSQCSVAGTLSATDLQTGDGGDKKEAAVASSGGSTFGEGDTPPTEMANDPKTSGPAASTFDASADKAAESFAAQMDGVAPADNGGGGTFDKI